MRLSARVDYALRAMAELATAAAPRTVDQLASAQRIPSKYLVIFGDVTTPCPRSCPGERSPTCSMRH